MRPTVLARLNTLLSRLWLRLVVQLSDSGEAIGVTLAFGHPKSLMTQHPDNLHRKLRPVFTVYFRESDAPPGPLGLISPKLG